MSKADADVGTGLVGAPACGDVMKLQIRVDPSSNTISDVKFKTFGCGSAIASSSYLTELVRGMTLEDAAKIRNTEIAKELCLPPVKCTSCHADFSCRIGNIADSNEQCTARCWLKMRSSPQSRTITLRIRRLLRLTCLGPAHQCQKWKLKR